MSHLKKVFVLSFQNLYQITFTQEWENMPFSPFGATVEVAGAAPFLDRQPTDILLDGNVQDLPWMTTVATEEGLYPTAGIHQREISGFYSSKETGCGLPCHDSF